MRIIAHRGYSGKYPENTLTAIEKAFECGASWCEIDLQMTGDGEIVLSHDYCIGLRPIADMSLDELREVAPHVPTLRQVFERFPDRKFYLEIKDRKLTKPLALLLLEANVEPRNVVVSSFDAESICEFKKILPGIKTSLLLATVIPPTTAVEWGQRFLADFIHPCWENRAPYPHTLLPRKWVETVRNTGMEVVVWHEEREEELEKLVELPVWGICTNEVEVLKKVLDGVKR